MVGPILLVRPTLAKPTKSILAKPTLANVKVFFIFSLSLSGCVLVSFFLSLGVFSWNFGGVWKRRPQMCTFGVLGLLCEAPAALELPPETPSPRPLNNTRPPGDPWETRLLVPSQSAECVRGRRGFTRQPRTPNVYI